MQRVSSILTPYRCISKSRARCVNGHFYRYNSSGLTDPQPENLEVSSVEDVYQKWLKNPASVGNSWDSFFRSIVQGNHTNDQKYGHHDNYKIHKRSYGAGSSASKVVDDNLAVMEMIRSFQTRGHHLAKLDPLGLVASIERPPFIESEEVSYLHCRDEHTRIVRELKSRVKSDQVFRLPPDTFIGGIEVELPLKEIIKRLEETYCSSFGVEYEHLNNVAEINWIKKKFELPGVTKLSKDLRRLTMARLIRATGFEAFISKKYPSVKRFGAEGSEMLVPCLKQIVDKSTEFGVNTLIFGMAHRGRLNMIANVCRKPLLHIYSQFQDLDVQEPNEGDVKYHLGFLLDRVNKVTNKNVRCILIANPSHLECVNALVQGRARAEQFYRGDEQGKQVLPICVHGDTAMCGQGIIYELCQMSDIPSYTTRGTVHIVLNNQLGFTTIPLDSRSSAYCTDVAKVANSPVIHVNGHDPEAVIHAANVVAEYRAVFHKDIFLDIIMFRRSGHNEGDEPMFTQPIMYTRIQQTKPIMDIYGEKLINEGLVSAREIDDVKQKYEKICEEAFEESKKQTMFNPPDWVDTMWPDFPKNQKQEMPVTGVSEDILLHVANIHASPPPAGFVIHKGIERILKLRTDLINKKMFDWSLGEACAVGTLLKEGLHVRMAGQDFQRAAFSHRHYVLHHQTHDKMDYIPLNHLYPSQGVFHPINSNLSEYAVLGFEFGYSGTNPNALNVWEAQFGDFSDTAQCMLDTFISCAEAKWSKQSGLIINLPHGLEGMGADHSSARPERFLSMCVDDPNNYPTGSDAAFQQLKNCNWIVVHVTTPANLFHAMRRQVLLPFRKVLINFYPKSLIRLPASRSPLSDFKDGTSFLRVIPDPVNPSGVKKVVFSCGKVYYDFKKARKAKKLENEIALVRIEQVHPFPYDLLAAEAAKYPNAKFCFGQEEHMNYGYHHFVIPRLQKALGGKEIKLISRPAAASPATGFHKAHEKQLQKLLDDLINA